MNTIPTDVRTGANISLDTKTSLCVFLELPLSTSNGGALRTAGTNVPPGAQTLILDIYNDTRIHSAHSFNAVADAFITSQPLIVPSVHTLILAGRSSVYAPVNIQQIRPFLDAFPMLKRVDFCGCDSQQSTRWAANDDCPLEHLAFAAIDWWTITTLLGGCRAKSMRSLKFHSPIYQCDDPVAFTAAATSLEKLKTLHIVPLTAHPQFTFAKMLRPLLSLRSITDLRITYNVLSLMCHCGEGVGSIGSKPELPLPPILRSLDIQSFGLFDDEENATRLGYILKTLAQDLEAGYHRTLRSICVVVPGGLLHWLGHMDLTVIEEASRRRRIAFRCADLERMTRRCLPRSRTVS